MKGLFFMSNEHVELTKYRLERAKEDLENAKANLKDSYLKGAVNRSYYAIFHAVRAILALDGFDSNKHSGVIAYFNKNYVKSGKFDTEASIIIQKSFRIRNKSDYDDFYIVSRSDAEEQVNNAERFIRIVERFLKDFF